MLSVKPTLIIKSSGLFCCLFSIPHGTLSAAYLTLSIAANVTQSGVEGRESTAELSRSKPWGTRRCCRARSEKNSAGRCVRITGILTYGLRGGNGFVLCIFVFA